MEGTMKKNSTVGIIIICIITDFHSEN